MRLDKWLFVARFFKSRDLAQELVLGGHVRLNGHPCLKPATGVGAGDALTFVQGGRVRLIRITALCAKRGPARQAQNLYFDLESTAPLGPKPA